MTEETIFANALEKPADARAAYLAEACGNDETLRKRLEALLAASEKVGNFMANPAAAPEPFAATQDFDGSADRKVDNMTRTEGEGANDNEDSALEFLQPSTRPDSLGRLGHYEVLQVLGRGGFGIVFRAFDDMLQRVVALKVMTPQLAATSPARKRFLREARSSAQVRHENVVHVYEVAEQPLPYLAMEFIPGETLQQKLDRVGPLDVPETLRIGRQIAEGLAAAHATDLIHRDIKPGNVLLEGGQHKVKITDFGLARAADDASISQSGIIAGTPMYMAPEQAEGRTLDQRADLFSLGSVLYQMVSGRPPFRANTTVAVLKRVAEDRPRAIREIIPETPQWLCAIIAKLHAKNPDDRYQSAREVADVLADCEAQLKASSKLKDYSRIPRSQPQPSGPRRRFRSRRWAAAAALLLFLLGGLGFTEATGVTNVRGTAIRLFSPEGTLVVEVDDPGVSIKIDESDVVITGAGAKEIRLKPGQYNVEASKDGKLVRKELVTVTRNGRQVVRVSQEPATVPKTDGERDDADRRAAEYLLSHGGAVKVNGQDQEIKIAADLPRGPFRLTGVVLWNADGNQVSVTDVGLAVFKACVNITEIKTFRTRLSDAGLANFKNCKKLTFLRMEAPEAVTDEGLAAFKDCKNLTFLRLTNVPLTGAGLIHLKDCKNLASVHLYGTQVNDAALIHFKGWKSLTNLSLLGTQVSDAGLPRLAGLEGLTDLDLRETKVTAKGVEGLAKALAKCKITWDGGVIEPTASPDPDRRAAEYVLSIGGGVRVDGNDREIRAKGDLPTGAFQLTYVGLWQNKQVTDAGLALFKDCKDLTWLDLYGCNQITDAGLAHFKDCKNMSYLQLERVQVTDAALAVFADYKKLRHLELNHTQVTDAGLVHLKDCKNLTEIELLNLPVTDAGLAHLKDCKGLTQLWLSGTRVTDAGLAYFKDCKNLTLLSLADTSITNAGLGILKEWKKMAELSLTNTSITDAALILVKECKELKILRLEGTGASDAGLVEVAECKNLTYLGAKNTKVSAPGVERLRKALPQCKIEWDGGVIEPTASVDPDRRAAEYVLSIGGTVGINGEDRGIGAKGDLPAGAFRLTHVGLSQNKQVTDSGLAVFKDCRNLTSFDLDGCPITDAGLAHFKDCKNLSIVWLEGVPVTDAALAVFAGNTNLSTLLMGHTKVTDAGLAHLKDCTNLSSLSLLYLPVTDAGLAHLKDCKKLKDLDLRNTKVTDAGLAYFKDCQDLTSLWVWGTITDAGLGYFKDCKNLKGLDLSATSVTDAGLTILKEWTAVESLLLNGTKVSDAGLDHVKHCKNLKSLELRATKVSAAGIETLAKALPQCEIEWDGGSTSPDRRAAEYVLSVGGSVRVDGNDREIKAVAELPKGALRLTIADLHDNKKVTDAGLAVFKDCQNLKIIYLFYAGQVTDAGLVHLKDCKTITQLHLQGTAVTDEGLAYFKDSKIITNLYLEGPKITDTGLAHFKSCIDMRILALLSTEVTDMGLAQVKDYKNLWCFVLRSTKVTDAGLLHLTGLQNLAILDLNETNVSDAGLAHLQACKTLTKVNLQKTKVTATGIDKLKQALPKCKIEWDGGVIEPTASVDPDRRAAEYVLSIGGNSQQILDRKRR